MAVPFHLKDIPGVAELHDWFGYWPTFHDAEILSMLLNRKARSSIVVHTWKMTRDLDEKGDYGLAKHVVVEFILEGIRDLDLSGFNHQNVVVGIQIEEKDSGFLIRLNGSYGVEGSIDVDSLHSACTLVHRRLTASTCQARKTDTFRSSSVCSSQRN
ncbi:MAG TPA: Imm50 family immunity protein [Terriglobales bacterium]